MLVGGDGQQTPVPLRPLTTSPRITGSETLELERVSDFPMLEKALSLYQAAGQGMPPRRIDPTIIPKPLIPYLLYLDHEPDTLRVRLAGATTCANHGGELRGRTVHDIFPERDADDMLREAKELAKSGEPTLTRRNFGGMTGETISYVRLTLPIAPDGYIVSRQLNVVDPDTFKSAKPPRY